ncbi:hypothetical protein H6G89_12950 [Oscillatoria sp. FACHB-1407]|uniref:hypothetical protein n=1 Tax=Oscillatoria sp. FACHB-1407 TaxID=2692847 RepID=UPI0016873A88|nr:hypothetical protein [Oscillatoria sp. FACHB-1407]MBD2461955.1 hypothetical protein [Oscillatoria sp. FACHB-1407]
MTKTDVGRGRFSGLLTANPRNYLQNLPLQASAFALETGASSNYRYQDVLQTNRFVAINLWLMSLTTAVSLK